MKPLLPSFFAGLALILASNWFLTRPEKFENGNIVRSNSDTQRARSANPNVDLNVGWSNLDSVAQPSGKNAGSAATPIGVKPIDIAYQYFRNGNSLAALQTLENARWESLENIGFFGDLMGLCYERTPESTHRYVAELKARGGPTMENYLWQATIAPQLCQGFKVAPIDDNVAFARYKELSAARRKQESVTRSSPEFRAYSDAQVVATDDPAKLWDLMRMQGSFQGAAGAEYFQVRPNDGVNQFSQSPSLSRAQSVAIMRIRCDLTRSCGPDQIDSLLLCRQYLQCRPGISVEGVWQNVASPYELRAAEAIYQEYLTRRAARTQG